MARERKFKPRPGQVDFTGLRFAPVINCVVRHRGKILLVRRSKDLRLYPGCWNGISGFLDDGKSLREKAIQELGEEIGLGERDIASIRPGRIFEQEEAKYKKTWIVHPVLASVKTDKIRLDWEADEYRWVKPAEARKLRLLPGFDKVLAALFRRV